MRLKLGVFFLVLAGLVAFLVGCQSDPEEKRAVITVSSINDNQPYFSDVISQGDSVYDRSGTPVTWDDYVDEDWVNVTFYNKPTTRSTRPSRARRSVITSSRDT